MAAQNAPVDPKKSKLFRRLFKIADEREELLADYGCAIQKSMLIHGRLYISKTFLCFFSNIFGSITEEKIRY
jgi:hypothetical protein